MPHESLSHPLIGQTFPVLDHGSVTLVDFMGTDADIVDAARNSYKKGTKRVSDDETLIRYLMRHRHSTPVECCVVKLHVKLPIFVERQWARHRTAGWSEVSARYSILPEETHTPEPEDVCFQSDDNKQGRSGQVPEDLYNVFLQHCETTSQAAFMAYHDDLTNGVARETARINLPLSTYTEKTWWINLHNMFHLLGLRMDSHAQKEIRVYADIIGNEIISQLFPKAWQAFLDYHLNAVRLTAIEWRILSEFMKSQPVAGTEMVEFAEQRELWPENASKRERNEFAEKVGRLFS